MSRWAPVHPSMSTQPNGWRGVPLYSNPLAVPLYSQPGMRVGEMSDADKQAVRSTLWTTVLAFGGGLALLYVALRGARL